MTGTHDGFPELLDRYLAGESTPEEHERIDQLLDCQPNALERLASLSAKLGVRLEEIPGRPTPYSQIRDAVRARGVGEPRPSSDSGPGRVVNNTGSVRQRLSGSRVFGRRPLPKDASLGKQTLRGRATYA